MKKLIGTVAALLLVASAAFADFTFGAWLRVLGTPLASDGDETIYAGMTNSWGYGARAARMDVNAASDDGKAGLSFGIYDDVWSGFGDGGTCALWVKPVDMLKVSLGKYDYARVRSDFCYGSWNWLRVGNTVAWGEGITFPQLGAQAGMLLELEPIDGLLVIWNLPMDALAAGGAFDGTMEAYEMFEKQHIAATYEIENIGKIHLGWAGNGGRKHATEGWAAGFYKGTASATNTDYISYADALKLPAGSLDLGSATVTKNGDSYVWDAGKKASGDEYKYLGDISAAFDLTAVENLYVTVGGTFSIADGDYKKACTSGFQTAKFALGASYKVMDNFTVYGDFSMAIFDKGGAASDIDPKMGFGIGLDYGVMDNLTLNVDFRGLIPNNSKDPDFSFLIGAQYACSSNGYIGAAFQGFIKGAKGTSGAIYPTTADKFSFAVPIAVSVWF